MSPPRSSRRPGPPGEEAARDPLAFPPLTHPRRLRAELVGGILRSRRPVPDETFDEIYPEPVRRASAAHWTPVRVCARVVELLRLEPRDRLLDIGAGVGKFCIVAAAMSGARVRGVEREPRLVAVAREAARRIGVEVDLVAGTFDGIDPSSIDVAYLFNPFTEALLLPGVRDVAADRSAGRIAADIAAAEQLFERTRVGARVVTFCGFGGEVPPTYELRARET